MDPSIRRNRIPLSSPSKLHDLELGRPLGQSRRRLRRWKRVIELELDRLDPTAPDLGIDLEEHYEDIRRLTSWRAGKLCARDGWELEDLIGDVVVAVEVRNRGTCPWDPRRGALSTYLYRIITQVVSRRLVRQRARPTLVGDDILVDGPKEPIAIESYQSAIDETVDAMVRWRRLHEQRPREIDALVRSGGVIRQAARELELSPRHVGPVAAAAKEILRGRTPRGHGP